MAAPGDPAIRRHHSSVVSERADQLFNRCKSSRLALRHTTAIRKLIRLEVLVLDDLCPQALDASDTADLYELGVERPEQVAKVVTCNREPVEWLARMTDGLLPMRLRPAPMMRLTEPIVDGDSYRCRWKRKPTPPDDRQNRHPTVGDTGLELRTPPRAVSIATSTLEAPWVRSYATGVELAPSRWRAAITTPTSDRTSPSPRPPRSPWGSRVASQLPVHTVPSRRRSACAEDPLRHQRRASTLS